jgi:2,4-dienoyl-CoA reductase (NADPH2)
MGRKLLADPDLPNKLAEGRTLDIRPCMYHYRCISQIFIREGVRCAVNASTGRERELRLDPAGERQRVLVIGGGPAGLEAARLAALRGHEVTLVESSERLGGRLVYASQTYAPNGDVLRWLIRQVEQAGIEVQLSTRVDAEHVRAWGADVVIAAIGGRWARPDVPGGDSANVYTVDALDSWLVDGKALPGERVVVIGGGRAGMGLADLASRQGHAVTVLERSGVFAAQVGLPGRWRLVHELQERGVDLVADAVVTAVGHDHVQFTVGGETRSASSDLVLVAECSSDANAGVEMLRSAGVPVHAVGDCNGAGFIEGAMLDAATLAVTL